MDSKEKILQRLTTQEKFNLKDSIVEIEKRKNEINPNDYEEFPISLHPHRKVLYIESTPEDRKKEAMDLRQHNKKMLPFYFIAIVALVIMAIFLYKNYFVDLLAFAAPAAAAYNLRKNSQDANFFDSGYQPVKKTKAVTPDSEYQPNEDFQQLELDTLETQQISDNNNNNNNISTPILEPQSSNVVPLEDEDLETASKTLEENTEKHRTCVLI